MLDNLRHHSLAIAALFVGQVLVVECLEHRVHVVHASCKITNTDTISDQGSTKMESSLTHLGEAA